MTLFGNVRNALAFVHDVCAAAVSWYCAYLLRFNFDIPPQFYDGMLRSYVWVLPLHAAVAWRLGLYRGLWRYASLPDLKRIVVAVGLSAILVVASAALMGLQGQVPRSVLALNPLLLICLMMGSRIAYRVFKEHRLYGHAHLRGEPVLVLGAGDTAALLARELQRNPEWHVVGFVDEDATKHGRELNGIKVYGGLSNLADLVEHLGTRYAILALPEAPAGVRRHAIEAANALGLAVMTVPAISDLLSGKVTVTEIRQVELEDLLGREAVSLDEEGLHQLLDDKVMLITGAGGSIGSELCRQVTAYRPRRLILLELSEFALYQIEQEFRRDYASADIVCLVGDVRDEFRMTQIYEDYQPEVVIHAAAYKHVPLMESGNVWEVLRNNVFGTLVVARLAARFGVEKFVFISTDKAVNPTSVMGVSKRLAELTCQAVQQGARTSFVSVRFGNVLGSTGSVIPKFREQIATGGPVTVTHPEINRFFMTIPEAAQLVLQASEMGDHGEIFVLDMGEPVRIADLARNMIRLSGFTEEEIPIVYTGLRPGEKLYEELLADVESTLPTRHAKLRISRSNFALSSGWLSALESWLRGASESDEPKLRARLREWVPEYEPPQNTG